MTDEQPESQESQSLIGGLLAPLRAPQRVFTDIETISSTLRSPLERIDRKVEELEKIEESITTRMDAIHDDPTRACSRSRRRSGRCARRCSRCRAISPPS